MKKCQPQVICGKLMAHSYDLKSFIKEMKISSLLRGV